MTIGQHQSAYVALTVLNLFFNFSCQRTPLHVAVEEGQECTVESLVEKYQADVNNKDIDGVSKGSLFTTLKHVHIHSVVQNSLEIHQSIERLSAFKLQSVW